MLALRDAVLGVETVETADPWRKPRRTGRDEQYPLCIVLCLEFSGSRVTKARLAL